MAGAIYTIGLPSNVVFERLDGELPMSVTDRNVDLVIPILINRVMPDWFIHLNGLIDCYFYH